MPGLSGKLQQSKYMQSTFMHDMHCLQCVSIDHSEEGGEVKGNIQLWEDEVW